MSQALPLDAGGHEPLSLRVVWSGGNPMLELEVDGFVNKLAAQDGRWRISLEVHHQPSNAQRG